MSSDLLQQAMVDAKALKEAAMKNAENALIEKYSQEFNQSIQKLLEQEDVAAQPLMAAPPAAPPTDPAAAAAPPMDPAADPAALDPMADMSGMEMGSSDQSKAFDKVPGAFEGVDDEQMITINFDQLKTTLNEMLGIRIKNEANDGGGKQEFPVQGDALDVGAEEPDLVVKVVGAAGEDVIDLGGEELELEDGMGGSTDIMGSSGVEELEEIELDEEMPQVVNPKIVSAQKKVGDEKADVGEAEKSLADEQAKQAQAAAAQAALNPVASMMEEEFELTEEELQELAETMMVDLNVGNLSDGYMGSTETQKREQRNVELAAARDDKAREEREEEVERMADLVKENKELKKLNNETYKAVSSLKEQLMKTNLLNAKLLYTNKALANVSLNERQKQNIVESISKADSVLAAKTIYETAKNAVEGVAKTKEAPQTLREALNRAATPFVVKKAVEANPMAERLKALAGIKKQ